MLFARFGAHSRIALDLDWVLEAQQGHMMQGAYRTDQPPHRALPVHLPECGVPHAFLIVMHVDGVELEDVPSKVE